MFGNNIILYCSLGFFCLIVFWGGRIFFDKTKRQKFERFFQKKLESRLLDFHSHNIHHYGKILPSRLKPFLYQSGILRNPLQLLNDFLTALLVFSILCNFFYDFSLALIVSFSLSMIVVLAIAKTQQNYWAKAFDNHFSDAVTLMRDSIKVGLTLNQGFTAVEKELKGPIKEEFRFITQKLKVGVSLDSIFNGMMQRIENPYFILFCRALVMNHLTGGSLGILFERLQEIINEKRKLDRQVKVLTSQARSNALAATLIPLFFVGIMMRSNPVFIDFFLYDPLGSSLSYVAAYLFIGNILFIRLAIAFIKRN